MYEYIVAVKDSVGTYLDLDERLRQDGITFIVRKVTTEETKNSPLKEMSVIENVPFNRNVSFVFNEESYKGFVYILSSDANVHFQTVSVKHQQKDFSKLQRSETLSKMSDSLFLQLIVNTQSINIGQNIIKTSTFDSAHTVDKKHFLGVDLFPLLLITPAQS